MTKTSEDQPGERLQKRRSFTTATQNGSANSRLSIINILQRNSNSILQRLSRPAFTSAALACALLLASCATAPTHPPVPPVRAEQVPRPPPTRTVLIWQPGHWDWTGQAYVWASGIWVERAGHGTLWQDGFWKDEAGRSDWIAAHWL